MLTTKRLEKIIELEDNLRAEYQSQLDAKSADIEAAGKQRDEQKAVIEKQLEQIKTLSTQASANKKLEQQNREMHQRCDNLKEDMATQKKRLKTLQKDLADERAQVAALKQFDPAKMKKNLDANKKKLAEKATATDLLQKSLNKAKAENTELQLKVKELEVKLEELEPAVVETDAETEVEIEEEAAA